MTQVEDLWETYLPENKGGYETMSNLKMYILVKRSVPVGLGVNAVGHTSLATYLRFKDDPVLQEWVTSKHFRKVTCVVSDREFEKAKSYPDHVVMTENALAHQVNSEVAIGFKPREEWPDFFKSLKLFGSHLQEKEPKKLALDHPFSPTRNDPKECSACDYIERLHYEE